MRDGIEPESNPIWNDLTKIEPLVLAGYLRHEHPQTIAFIIQNLEPAFAAAVLILMPENRAGPATLRMVRMAGVQPQVRRIVERTLSAEWAGVAHTPAVPEPVPAVAAVLEKMEDWAAQRFMSCFDYYDPDRAEPLRDRLYPEEAAKQRAEEAEKDRQFTESLDYAPIAGMPQPANVVSVDFISKAASPKAIQAELSPDAPFAAILRSISSIHRFTDDPALHDPPSAEPLNADDAFPTEPVASEPEPATPQAGSEPPPEPQPLSEPNMPPNVGGLQALSNAMLCTYERIPILELVFDRWAGLSAGSRLNGLMASSLCKFLGTNLEVGLDQISSVRLGDYLNSVRLPALLAVFKAEPSNEHGLLYLDTNMVFVLIEAMLGCREKMPGPPVSFERQTFTAIERNLITAFAEIVLADLSTAFTTVTTESFHLVNVVANPRFATIGTPITAAVLARTRIETECAGGQFEMLLPYTMLDTVQKLPFYPKDLTRWHRHVDACLARTTVTAAVEWGQTKLTIGTVTALLPGTVVTLPTAPDGPFPLTVGGVTVASVRLGRSGSKLVARIVVTHIGAGVHDMTTDDQADETPLELRVNEVPPETAPAANTVLDRVPLTVSVVIGSVKMTVGQLKALRPGSPIVLDREFGDKADIMVNDCLIAHGEIVQVDTKVGMVVSDLVDVDECSGSAKG